MAWRYDLPKCPVSPADRGEYMKPKIQSSDGGVEGHAANPSGIADGDGPLTCDGRIVKGAGVEPGPSEAPSSVSTPAQDATALADELDRRKSYVMSAGLFESAGIMADAAAFLRATSQTPDADSYRNIIDEAMIVRHLGVAKGDARSEFDQILNWEVSVALDPRVSERAQALIDQGRPSASAQTPDAVRKAVAELVANRDGNTLVTGNRGINIADHDKEKYRKFADRILTLVGRGAVIGWQDIETAPHETRVLLGWIYDGAWFCETGMASHGWRRNGISNMSRHGQATHWQPLPDGPAK